MALINRKIKNISRKLKQQSSVTTAHVCAMCISLCGTQYSTHHFAKISNNFIFLFLLFLFCNVAVNVLKLQFVQSPLLLNCIEIWPTVDGCLVEPEPNYGNMVWLHVLRYQGKINHTVQDTY